MFSDIIKYILKHELLIIYNLAQNLTNITGDINGSNNIRDLGEVDKFGNIIMQQSSPLSLVMTFIRKKEYDFFDSLQFNSQQYEKWQVLCLMQA